MPSSSSSSATIPLPRSSDVSYDLSSSSSSSQQQPHTTPIAHFVSSPNVHPTGSLIAVSDSYIVYAVKNGLVRAIDRRKASRTLLRGHSVRVTDLAFFPSHGGGAGGRSDARTDVLGTVGGEGDDARVLVWRLYDPAAVRSDGGGGSSSTEDASKEEIGSERLLEVRYAPAVRMVWHPSNPNRFLLLHRNNSRGAGVVVETTRLATDRHPTERHAVCACGGDGTDLGRAGVVLRAEREDDGHVCTDVSWSRRDARYLLQCGTGGVVRLWDWRGSSESEQRANATATLRESADVVDSVHFVHRGKTPESGTHNGGADNDRFLTEPFVSGVRHNTEISLWSGFRVRDGVVGADKLRVLRIADPTVPSPLRLRCATCASDGRRHDRAYVVLADGDAGRLLSIRVDASRRDLDSVTPFAVKEPVLSWAVLGETIESESDETGDEEEGEIVDGKVFEVSLFCVQPKAVQLLRLKPKMMRPPSGNEGSLREGLSLLKMEPRQYVVSDATMKSESDTNHVGAEKVDAAHYDYEDSDSDEEEEKKGPSSDEEDDNDNGFKIVSSPVAGPPPGLAPPGGGGGDPSSFANWLGAIVSPPPTGAAPSVPPGMEAVPPPTRTTPARTQPEKSLFLSPMELLKAGGTTTSTSSSVPNSHNPPAPPSSSQGRTSSRSANRSPPQKSGIVGPPPSSSTRRRSPKRSNTPKRSDTPKRGNVDGRSKSGGGGGKSGGNTIPAAAPGSQKIHILKRADPPPPPAVPPPAVVSSGVAGGGADASQHVEEIVKRTLHAQLKLHEDTVVSELQRCVRAETSKLHDRTKDALADAATRAVADRGQEDSSARRLLREIEPAVTKPLVTAVTKHLKDREKKIVREVVDGVRAAVEEPLVREFHKSMREVLVPAYEAATNRVFDQVARAVAPVPGRAAEEQRRSTEHLAAQVVALTRQVAALSGELTAMRTALANNAEPSSRAPPAPSPPQTTQHDPVEALQKEISLLLSQNNHEAAFTKALSASSAEVALFCCKRADLSSLLNDANGSGGRPLLSQPILLCLAQQLGSVLTITRDVSDVWTVSGWLQDIAVSVDPTDPSIQRHVGEIMRAVVGNVHGKLNGDPAVAADAKLRRKLQMLLQVVRGVGSGS